MLPVTSSGLSALSPSPRLFDYLGHLLLSTTHTTRHHSVVFRYGLSVNLVVFQCATGLQACCVVVVWAARLVNYPALISLLRGVANLMCLTIIACCAPGSRSITVCPIALDLIRLVLCVYFLMDTILYISDMSPTYIPRYYPQTCYQPVSLSPLHHVFVAVVVGMFKPAVMCDYADARVVFPGGVAPASRRALASLEHSGRTVSAIRQYACVDTTCGRTTVVVC